MGVINAYQELGFSIGPPRLCDPTDNTVQRALARRLSGAYHYRQRPAQVGNTEVAQQ